MPNGVGLPPHHERRFCELVERQIDAQQDILGLAMTLEPGGQALQFKQAFHVQAIDAPFERGIEFAIEFTRPAENDRHIRKMLAHPRKLAAG